jgi:hydroxypyruvate isomerase
MSPRYLIEFALRNKEDGMKKIPSSRREFLKSAALAASALSLAPARLKGQAAPSASAGQAGTGSSSPSGAFKLKYAPPLGMFEAHAGKNPVDQLKFMADQGFRAMFDNGLMGRPVADQEAIARETARTGLAIGPFVAYADFTVKTFVTKDKSVRDLMAGKLKTAIETAKRTGCKWTLVVPGRYDESLDWDYQTANVIENLKWCAGVVEPSGLIIVLEPLNPKNHPGLFLTKMSQAYQICRAVGSPCLKIIDDMYHQQITEGNIIPNIDACWDEIAAYHIGDNPGRKEPGTGELNYRNIFKHLHAKGFQGVLGMEHGKSKPGQDGEKAVIDAYRAADNF